MGVSDVVQNAVASVTGAIAKGYFQIQDTRKDTESEVQLKDTQKVSGSGGGVAGAVANKAKNKIVSVGTQSLANRLGSLTGINKLNTAGEYNRTFELQFNPNSISLQSRAGDDDVMKNDYNAGHRKQMKMGSMSLHIELSVTFIFDQVNNRAAFAQDNLDILSVNRVASQVIEAGWSKLMSGGKNVSVQEATEAFIAALREVKLRKCCFQWGDMRYPGYLRHVNSKYSMFDFMGRPVRSEVTVIMYLEDEGIEKQNLGMWDDAYEKVFGGGSKSLVKASQKVGNLLNL